MTTITIYDPPMCCSTGVCSTEVDPKLAQFAGDIDWLKTQGAEVTRFNLAQEPGRFVESRAVKIILDRSGGDELPAILVGDKLVSSGHYPSRDELTAMAGLKVMPPHTEMTARTSEPFTPRTDEPRVASNACCGGTKSTKCC